MIIPKYTSNSPAYPSKILKKKWQQRDFAIHKDKLQHVRGQTDTSQPLSLKFPLLKSKKRQIQEGKQMSEIDKNVDQLTEIERENRLLYEKMSIIMTNNMEESLIIQKPMKNLTTLNESGNSSLNLNSKRSLNKMFRQREIKKINRENKVSFRMNYIRDKGDARQVVSIEESL